MLRVRQGFVVFAVAALGQPLRQESPEKDLLSGQAAIRWSLRISPVRLGESQRLQTSIRAEIGTGEAEGRHLAFSVQIRDRDNRIYTSRSFTEGTRSSHLTLFQPVCIVPGEYQVTAAVYDFQSGKRDRKQASLRVPELRHDPLPSIWRDLPKVEFSRCDSTQLSLPLQTRKPVRIEIVVNEPLNRAWMSSVIPRLEVISRLAIGNGSLDVTVLNLERRKISFSQERVKGLDRRGVRAALRENDPLVIDAQSLTNYKDDAQFFVSEIRRRLQEQDSEIERALIILTPPLTFPQGEDLTPIRATPQPRSHVFYIRCRWLVYAYRLPVVGFGARPRLLRSDPNADSLERTLKPLNPRLFDVTTPIQFRRTLGEIMREISQL